MRYTSKHAQSAFERLADAVGATIADPAWKIADPRREGAWILDHNSVYGGYVIAAYVAGSPPYAGDDRPQTYTAETHPLGSERYSAREFCERVNFALRVKGLS